MKFKFFKLCFLIVLIAFLFYGCIPSSDKPYVVSTVPSNNATNINPANNIVITFSKPMNKTATEAAFSINVVSPTSTITWNSNSTEMSYYPTSSPLEYNSSYTFTISKDAKDLSGNELENEVSVNFSTTNDTQSPTVVSTTPTNGSNNVNPANNVAVKFSEKMNKADTESAFSINSASAIGSFVWNSGSTEVQFYPTTPFAVSTSYTITIGTGAKDLVGNPLESEVTIQFTTKNDIPPVTDGCDTSNQIGKRIVAVFNSDISGWSSIDTCNFNSVVFPSSTKKVDKEETIADKLVGLRAEPNYNQDYINSIPDIEEPGRSYKVGDIKMFKQTGYTLKYSRTHCDVWLRTIDDDGNNGQGGDIEDTDTDGDGVSLENYANYFNDYSWQDVHDNFSTNMPTKIDILFEDMGSSPAGYYSGGNSIYLNTIVAQNGTVNNYMEPNPIFTNGTLTHELQHLVEDYNNCYFDTWLNELCSSTAESVWSGQTGIYAMFYNKHSEEFNEVNLLGWSSPDHRHQYALAALLGTWISYQSRNGSDKGVFFRQLYVNKSFNSDSVYIFVKTAADVGVFTGTVNYSSEASVRAAWRNIYSRFLSAMVKPTDDPDSWNGALADPITNFTDPEDNVTPIKPEIHLYTPGKIAIDPSGFAFVKTDKDVTETDTYMVYDNYNAQFD